MVLYNKIDKTGGYMRRVKCPICAKPFMLVSDDIYIDFDLREANKELRYQGNNLNQLTRLCHQGEIRVVNLDTLLTSYRRILLAIGGDANGDRK